MEKSVKLAVGIYLAIILIICSIYLAFILIGSLNGKDMSNSVLDTDHSRINNTSRNSNEDVTSSNNESNNTKAHSFNLSLSIHISFDYNSFVTMIFLSCSKKR